MKPSVRQVGSPRTMVSIEETRSRAGLIEVYRMMHELSSVPVTAFSQSTTNSCTRGHPENWLKLTVELAQDSVSFPHER